MKTMKICMMVVGMTFLGTTTSFGRTNNNNGRQEMERKEIKVEQREVRRVDDGKTYKMETGNHKVEVRNSSTSDVVTGVVTGIVVGTVVNSLLNLVTK
jgi:F0F1-type ATP synthase assembly protein I